MTLSDVVLTRTSQRSYLPDPISPLQREELQKAIDACSQRSGLRLQLVCDRPEPFASLRKSYGVLKGVRNYLVLAGPAADPDLEEKCGYYGEELVLTAGAMGLGTCWVGGTYDRESCLCHLQEGERLVCVAAVGHTPEERGGREKLIALASKRKSKSQSELAGNLSGAPSWFMSGIAAVQRAPSARNRQAYRFTWQKDGTALAQVTGAHEFSMVDLGIAKYHFELGAHGGQWTWGDGGVFEKAVEEKSCGAVVWREQEGIRQYLLARHNGGHWSFPKGHVEAGEKEKDTARREIQEETGLTAEIDTGFRQVVTYYPKPGVVKDVVFFIAAPSGGEEQAQLEEIAEIGWFTFQEACPLVTFASDEEVLLAAERYLEGKRRT